LIARPADADGPRVYRVARFLAVRPLDRPAVVPDNFDLRSFLGNAWSIFRGDERFEVELNFAPAAARIVAETTWHHTQMVRRHTDGSATLTFSVDGLDEILWWLLAWAGFVTIVRPQALRDLFVNQLRAGLEQNESLKPV
jgi:predicted DNA-binding transcriptional regulator YafY